MPARSGVGGRGAGRGSTDCPLPGGGAAATRRWRRRVWPTVLRGQNFRHQTEPRVSPGAEQTTTSHERVVIPSPLPRREPRPLPRWSPCSPVNTLQARLRRGSPLLGGEGERQGKLRSREVKLFVLVAQRLEQKRALVPGSGPRQSTLYSSPRPRTRACRLPWKRCSLHPHT